MTPTLEELAEQAKLAASVAIERAGSGGGMRKWEVHAAIEALYAAARDLLKGNAP